MKKLKWINLVDASNLAKILGKAIWCFDNWLLDKYVLEFFKFNYKFVVNFLNGNIITSFYESLAMHHGLF